MSKKNTQVQSDQALAADQSEVQGEGDYRAARRYREKAEAFAASGDVESAVVEAKPRTPQERTDMDAAEQEGLSHSKAKGQ